MTARGKKSVLALVMLAAVLVPGVALLCRSVEPQADFTYVLGDSIKTLDPASMSWLNEIRMALGLWEGLTAYEPEGLAAGAGAAYFPPEISSDGCRYVFHLRPDGQWSNGDPVRAEDFVFGWRRAIEPGSASDYAFFITETVKGAKEYAQWRNDAVKTLRLLRDWSRGTAPQGQERRWLEQKLADEGFDMAEHPAAIAQAYRDWHLDVMESRFSQVGIRAVGDFELQVDLERPVPYFLDLTSFSVMLPIHRSIEKLRLRHEDIEALTLWVYDPQWVKPDYHAAGYPGLITNGAFALKVWKFKEYMLFEKNPYYWDRGHVVSQTILAKIITEANTAFLAYEQGEVDWLNDLTRLDFAWALVEAAQTGRRSDIHCQPAFGTYFYNFNCKELLENGRPNPFADVRVRKAFTLAVDREAIVSQVKKQGNQAAYHFIPPGSIPGYACPPGPGCDPAGARELLAQAGYPNGKNLPTVELLYNTGQGHEVIAQAVAEMWREQLGVEVRLQGKEIKSFAEDKKNQRYMMCRASWFGDYGDPTTFLDMLISDNGNNDSAFNDPAYDNLMAQAATTVDADQRMALLAQAESLIISQGFPILPIYYYVNLNAFRSDIQGIHLNARNMYFFKYLGKQNAASNEVRQTH